MQTCNLKQEVLLGEPVLCASARRNPSGKKEKKTVGSSSRRSLTGRTGDGGDGAERPAKAARDQGHQTIAARPASLLHIFVPLCVTINYFIDIIPSAFFLGGGGR